MNTRAILALVRNDLRLYFTDRRAVVIGVLVPILLAAFFGYIFAATGNGSREAGKVAIALVDEDQSTVSRAIAADLAADSMLDVLPLTRAQASDQVLRGKRHAAAIFPPGFGEKSVSALFSGRDKPSVELLVDPSQAISGRLVEGLLMQYSMQVISREAFAGAMGRSAADDYLARLQAQPDTPDRRELMNLLDSVKRLNAARDAADAQAAVAGDANALAANAGFQLSVPYAISSTPMQARKDVPYNGFAHSFAGMAVQFILFAGIDAGILLLLMRQRGIWQRIRSAPLGKAEFILARVLATSLISAFQLAVIYVAAVSIFGVRISGSVPGFLLVALMFCLLNAAFGLMLATLGRSAGATRGISIMVMLLLVMAGGAWVPSFIFPPWLQQASLATPTRWAVDGLDAMTWRGMPFADSLLPAAVLAGFALLCFAVAVWRFRWEE
jgi:ABC-2 type transport system permease protein